MSTIRSYLLKQTCKNSFLLQLEVELAVIIYISNRNYKGFCILFHFFQHRNPFNFVLEFFVIPLHMDKIMYETYLLSFLELKNFDFKISYLVV